MKKKISVLIYSLFDVFFQMAQNNRNYFELTKGKLSFLLDTF